MDISIMIIWIFTAILIVSGLAGLILPVLPGPLLLFGGLVLAAWAEGFTEVGGLTIMLLALLMLLATTIDFLAAALEIKHFRASSRACWGAVLGAIVGLFWGLPGMLLGPFFGAFLGELSLHRELRPAGFAGMGAWLGLILGTVAKVSIGLTMVGIFVVARCL
jgi:hypothetical protein